MEKDYVLGTNKGELERLGLQHKIWKPAAIDSWQKAGIRKGARILDIGAGPGYASIDLAAIAGKEGEVVAIERSEHFSENIKELARKNNLNIKVINKDLLTDNFEETGFDFSWCRWVASFVNNSGLIAKKVHNALKPRGKAIFQEYVNYATWKLIPKSELFEEYVALVMKSWRFNKAEPDITSELISSLLSVEFRITDTKPLIYTITPKNEMWKWPESFIELNLSRLLELNLIKENKAKAISNEIQKASINDNSIMITPMVMEIIAVKN